MSELSIEFKRSVINRYGAKGEEWLDNINSIIEKYITKFKLTNVKLEKNLSINVVLFATSKEYGDVVMKVCAPTITSMNEINYIRLCKQKYFEKCLYYSLEDRVIILEKITPGYPLSEIQDQNERINVFCDIVNEMVTDEIPTDKFKSYEEELRERIKLIENNKKEYNDVLEMLDVAINFYEEISNMCLPKYVLHEDLHHNNILKSEDGWRVIDPHGTIAEKIFETVMFIRNELLYTNLDEIDNIVTLISEKISEDKILIYKACYVYCFFKVAYHIKVKNDINKIMQNIKICKKVQEYIK